MEQTYTQETIEQAARYLLKAADGKFYGAVELHRKGALYNIRRARASGLQPNGSWLSCWDKVLKAFWSM